MSTDGNCDYPVGDCILASEYQALRARVEKLEKALEQCICNEPISLQAFADRCQRVAQEALTDSRDGNVT